MDEYKIYQRIWKRYNNPRRAVIKTGKGFGDGYDFSITCNISIKDDEVCTKIFKIIKNLNKNFPNNYVIPKSIYHISIPKIKDVKKDFGRKILSTYTKHLTEIAKKFPPFEIDVIGLNHFHNVIFAQTFSNGILHKLDKEISKKLGVVEPFAYVPHIATLYFGAKPDGLFKAVEENYRDTNFGKFIVNYIELVKWDLHAPNGFYEHTYVKKFELEGKY